MQMFFYQHVVSWLFSLLFLTVTQPLTFSTPLSQGRPLQSSTPSTYVEKQSNESIGSSDEMISKDVTSNTDHSVFRNLTTTLFPEADYINTTNQTQNGFLNGVATTSVLAAVCVFFFGLFMIRTFWWLKRRLQNSNGENRYQMFLSAVLWTNSLIAQRVLTVAERHNEIFHVYCDFIPGFTYVSCLP